MATPADESKQERPADSTGGRTPSPTAAPVATIFMVSRSDEVARRFPETYTPKAVYLGLYHVSSSKRSPTEPTKKACIGWLFREYGAAESAADECLSKLKDELKSVIDCYYRLDDELSRLGTPVKFDVEAAAAAQWLFQDACFIIAMLSLEFSRSQAGGSATPNKSDGSKSNEKASLSEILKSSSSEQIKSDLMKLSNQIPMRVINTVLEHAKVPGSTSAKWFAHWSRIQFDDSPLARATPIHPTYHLVHYLQSTYAAAQDQQIPAAGSVDVSATPPPVEQQQLPSAEEVRRGGVHFTKPASASTSALEIRFTDNGKLEIPRINASAHWMVLLQSLVDFEQSLLRTNSSAAVTPVFSAYVKLLAGLLRSPVDVQLLRSGGVVVDNKLKSDQELVDFLTCLSAQVTGFPSTPRFNKLLTDVAKQRRTRPSPARIWMTNYLPNKVGGTWIRHAWKPLAALVIIAAIGTYTTSRVRARWKANKPQKSNAAGVVTVQLRIPSPTQIPK